MRGSYAVLADALGHDVLAGALLESAARGVSLVNVLSSTSAVDPGRLAFVLDRASPASVPVLRHPHPVMSLVAALPADLCERLLAVPVGRDVATGAVDVAVADAGDDHAAGEIAYWLDAPVHILRAPLSEMTAALGDLAGARSPVAGEARHPGRELPAPGDLAGARSPEGLDAGDAPPSERLRARPAPGPFADPAAEGEEAAPTRRGR